MWKVKPSNGETPVSNMSDVLSHGTTFYVYVITIYVYVITIYACGHGITVYVLAVTENYIMNSTEDWAIHSKKINETFLQ